MAYRKPLLIHPSVQDSFEQHRLSTDRLFLGILNLGPAGLTLNVSSGAITVTHTVHEITSPTDQVLSVINGGQHLDVLILKVAAGSSQITVQDVAPIKLAGSAKLKAEFDLIVLLKFGANWVELTRSINGA